MRNPPNFSSSSLGSFIPRRRTLIDLPPLHLDLMVNARNGLTSSHHRFCRLLDATKQSQIKEMSHWSQLCSCGLDFDSSPKPA